MGLGRYTPAVSRHLLHVASRGFALKQFADLGRRVPLSYGSHGLSVPLHLHGSHLDTLNAQH